MFARKWNTYPRQLSRMLVCLLVGCGSSQSSPVAPHPGGGTEISPAQPIPNSNPTHAAAKPRPPQPDDWFEDVTNRSGFDFTYTNGREANQYTLLESTGGGVALLDFDLDGDLNIFCTAGGRLTASPFAIQGRPIALYRNDGGWQFVDVTEQAGLKLPIDYSVGCAIGDFDCDGFPDVFVTCYGRSRLFRNTGQGDFLDATGSLPVSVEGFRTAAAFADCNGDGWPDLFVVGYVDTSEDPNSNCGKGGDGPRDVCGPTRYPAARDVLLSNAGDGTFRDVSDDVGIKPGGKGLGVLAVDWNDDHRIDFYVTNDTEGNFLYLAGDKAEFDEVAVQSGVAYAELGTPEGSMGVDWGDFDGDGRGDLWVSNYVIEDNSLYRNEGSQVFLNVTLQSGLGGGRRFSGWGTGFADFDSDGWLDLFVINGHVAYHDSSIPYEQPSFVYQNQAGKKFLNVTQAAGPYFSVPHPGRGAAMGDIDNDGALDLVIVHHNRPMTLLRNRLTPKNWIAVQLHGTAADRSAVGAKLVYRYQGRNLIRWIRGGGSYLSHSDSRILLPADANADAESSVEVVWPLGNRESFRTLVRNRTNHIIEGAGIREFE